MAGVPDATRFDEKHFCFIFRIRLVFDAFRHDVHLACREVDVTIPEIDPQCAVQDDERLVRIVVIMPDKVAFNFTILAYSPDPGSPVPVRSGDHIVAAMPVEEPGALFPRIKPRQPAFVIGSGRSRTAFTTLNTAVLPRSRGRA
jgi:hypothetical protein